MQIILASSNPHKLQEIQDIFQSIFPNLLVCCYHDRIKPYCIEEEGNSFQENALLKSKNVFAKLKAHQQIGPKELVLADDSGICVDALNGEPGIKSARYSGGGDAQNLFKLQQEIKKLPNQYSKAHFCACIAISSSLGDFSVHGFLHGHVSAQKKGENGFGYDPIFVPKNFQQTLAQLSPQEKNQISHRRAALEHACFVIKALQSSFN